MEGAYVGMIEKLTIELPSTQSAMSLSGNQEENLKIISKQTGANLVMRGQELLISGTKSQVELCDKLVRSLSDYWKSGKNITGVEIQTARQALDTNRQGDLQDLQRDVLARTRRGEEIRAKTFKQRQYVQAVRTHDLTFCIGPAGTGKTFLAAIFAVQALLSKQYERLI